MTRPWYLQNPSYDEVRMPRTTHAQTNRNGASDMIRLMLADDHQIVREGFKQLFALVDDIQVIAEAESGDMALRELRRQEPTVLMLDLTMPGLCGDDLIAKIRSEHPDLPILVVSMHNAPSIVQQALRAGASGYLSKDCDPETLIDAVRRVAHGGRYLDSRLAEEMAFEVAGISSDHHRLSDREYQIMRLLARGLMVTDIARQLAISHKTVSTHKARMMGKMGFSSHTELVRYVLQHGLDE